MKDGWLRRPIRLGAISAWTIRRRVGLLLAVGVSARLIQYLGDRGYWIDEASLQGNIVHKSLAGLFGPLDNTQLAPPGFLVLEWVTARALGDEPQALRLVPLLGGIGALFLFARLARWVLRPGSAWVAVGLFAMADDLIYFADELKQYSTDVAAAVAATLLGLTWRSGPPAGCRLAWLALVGAMLPWFSHPSAFVLAAVGVVALVDAARRRSGPEVAGLLAVGLVWLVSIAGVHAVAIRQLGPTRHGMWRFWDFAFPPWPPTGLWDLTWPLRRFLYLFVNPLNFETPLGPRLSALPIVGLFALGALRFARRDRAAFLLVTLPGLFAMLAAYVHRFPFHGRQVLFLVPALLLLIAEGAGVVRDRSRRGWAWVAVLLILFLVPAWRLIDHLSWPRNRLALSPYGDRRPAELDPYRFPF